MTTRLILLAALLAGCGNSSSSSSSSAETPTDPAPSVDPPSIPAPVVEEIPPPDPWLTELLVLTAYPVDDSAEPEAVDLSMRRLGAPAPACATAVTDASNTCMVELPIEGAPCQINFRFSDVPRKLTEISIWGPIDEGMSGWVDRVERTIDAQVVGESGPVGQRPDRRWRNENYFLHLHDHAQLPCGGLCPATLWIAHSDNLEAAADQHGFTVP